MRINKLFLTDFRNYSKKSWEFDGETTLIVGPNASGKTNILEAIYCLATGDSWRTETAKDMVRFGAEVAHIIGNVDENGGGVGLHLTLTGGTVNGKRSAAVLYKVDEVPRRRTDFVGRLKVVLFEPESLEIIIGDPSFRRRFLDEALSQTDREYARSLHSYTKALRIRNKLLDAIRDGRAKEETLEFWERTLVKHGSSIQNKRQDFVQWMNEKMAAFSSGLPRLPAGEAGRPAFGGTPRNDEKIIYLKLNYFPNVISSERLDGYRDREILAGFTFVGPQRDDFEISYGLWVMGSGSGVSREGESASSPSSRPDSQLTTHNSQLLSVFGSRGEQRMAVLRLKLLQAKWIEEKTAETPVLLLDDIFSELDSEHEEMVGELVKGRQTIMTATEIHKGHYPQAKVIELG